MNATPVNYYGVQAKLVEKEKVAAQVVKELGLEDGTTDFDDGELLGLDGGKELEPLLAFALAANAADGVRDDLAKAITAGRRSRQDSGGRREGAGDVRGGRGVDASALDRSSRTRHSSGSDSSGAGPEGHASSR